jgi:hypothetical protein
MGNGCRDPLIIDLDTSWRWVVSLMPRPLYPQGKSPWYTLDRRLGGPQNSLDDMEKRKFLALLGLELRPHDHPACRQSRYRKHYPSYTHTHTYPLHVRQGDTKRLVAVHTVSATDTWLWSPFNVLIFSPFPVCSAQDQAAGVLVWGASPPQFASDPEQLAQG